MKKILAQIVMVLVAFTPLLSQAGGDEVVVVYNKKMPESKAVADYYAKLRHVPAKQIYGFALTTGETMSRKEFRDALQLPLAKKLEADGLWKIAKVTVPATNGQPERVVRRVVASKIRYAVLCYGVPLRIANDPGLHETVPTNVVGFFRSNGAAVESDLALLPEVEMNLPLAALVPNPFYRTTNAASMNPTNGILLVTRLDGPGPDIARGEVDKALAAERDGLWGRAYFDARGLKPDSGYFYGDQTILGAAQIAKVLGYETTVDDKPGTFSTDFPMSHIAIYAGWYDENVSGPFTLPKVEFMPGAFAYHLHSFSANTIRSATNRWVGPLLAKGATCSMGTIDEPSLQFTPDIAVFLARWSINRMTFGEAAWAAQPALSWQTTIIGDPLYRPFEKSPEQLHRELARQNSPLAEWSYLWLINANAARGAPTGKLIELLESLPARTNSAVLTEKLASLCVTAGKPSSAIDYYRKALRLNPSPEQRIRIRLALGEKLQEQKQTADAIDDYKKLLEESPDYPGRGAIEEKIKSLGQKPAANSP